MEPLSARRSRIEGDRVGPSETHTVRAGRGWRFHMVSAVRRGERGRQETYGAEDTGPRQAVAGSSGAGLRSEEAHARGGGQGGRKGPSCRSQRRGHTGDNSGTAESGQNWVVGRGNRREQRGSLRKGHQRRARLSRGATKRRRAATSAYRLTGACIERTVTTRRTGPYPTILGPLRGLSCEADEIDWTR